ncbi:phospho-sugar mutase [Labedaea rhizosphaerae]|uniref:Phosphomannomutase n=1 Tax=Labedaea rhizosphaerae TaxID=598644 RepID=A0A4R6S334_LABRH|nr:phospho-sugar mutase [Labedaea rhizosphaerae]TDP93614.1 phosphomannomutase [Labedaea rhizosphaerae]
MKLVTELRDKAFRWLADDPDAGDKAELQQVLARAMGGDETAVAELEDRMSGELTFGTAGLRGPERAGPNGMNTAVVVRATAGIAAWLRAQGHAGGVVMVGRDARHGSAKFAEAVASVLAGAGFDARVLPGPLPTPILSFLTRGTAAVAGIQITASHNPPADNGYKVYLSDGAQISPAEANVIEAAIRGGAAAVSVPRSDTYTTVSSSEVDTYATHVAALARGDSRDLTVALTPMHGVGGATAVDVLARAGFTDVHLVAPQAEPDPAFPTVSFPNPEEPGATDLLLATASDVDADLAIALDPDADRCALGVRSPDGGWRMLRGDETGVLLGDYILSTLDRMTHPDPLVATTIVSSSMLGSVAAAHGARYDETLTGFKWLVRAGDGHGTGLVYAYEEALGHCVDPDSVRDKDGISAAVLACSLAASLKAAGRTVLDALDDLAVAHGVHVTDQVSVRVTDLARIGQLMARLRSAPPSSIAGVAVTAEDLLPRTDGLRWSGEGVRVVVRPSGTEPKVKAYLQVKAPVADASALADVRSAATEKLASVRDEVAALLAG